jgi:hypothetical protein
MRRTKRHVVTNHPNAQRPFARTPSVDRTSQLLWTDDDHLQVGGTHFFLTLDPKTWKEQSTSDRFVLLKNKAMIQSFLRFAPERVDNIIDLGFFKGGSVALYQELFSPARMVGLDLRSRRIDGLDRFIAQHSLGEKVRTYYDTDQGDLEGLDRIVRENFGDEPLDLVVDDCSHTYEMTKASLNMLLPRLRAGGLYVIEDWDWAHWPGEQWQGPANQYAAEENPLSKLILELVMVVGSRPDLISEMTVLNSQVYLTRGGEAVADAGFDISESYLTAGRQILCDGSAAG